MREIVLDTETTGFNPEGGDRIVEIGAIELWNHLPTGKTYHQYINPERSMPQDAFEVHGIGPDLLEPPQDPAPGAVLLRDKPVFSHVGQAFADFVGDAKLVIHNASFDMKFLNAELKWIGLPTLPWEPGHRYVGDCTAKISGCAGILGCFVPAVQHRQLEPDLARRATRFRDLGRSLS